ncbi:hypothetical protein [Kitasatospora sp. NPDC005751]|uniref:hypothetical protein n=1 Tax=Kitasatospora sp. NPDC005751 TaxID=3157064 RepID=UPI0033C75469
MGGQVQFTEQERLQRVQGLLSGTRSQAKVGRALAQGGGYGNVLIGALLHGADRVRQGYPPTDLERMMLGVLGTVAADTEAREWGRVYRESVTSGGASVVPDVIRSLPVGRGYTIADLRRDMPQLVQEAVACPNVQVVDPYAAATGQPDSAAFLAAMRETGFAVTVFARPALSAAGAQSEDGQAADTPAGPVGGAGDDAGTHADETFRVRLELENFYVHREVGDQWWSDDEIYWVASTSAGPDSGGRTFTSKEFQDVHEGKTFTFPADNKVLFDGTFKGLLGTMIAAWEADQSSAAWWEALQKALSDALASLDLLMLVDTFIGIIPGPVGVAFELAKIFVFLFEVFRNYDDMSATRSIVMNREDLARLSYKGGTSWHFDGEGHHELRVKYTGDKVPFPQGTVEYIAGDGDTWSAPISLGWQSTQAPALALYNGKLHALFVRAQDNGVMWSRLEGGTWTAPQKIGGDATHYAPALAAGHGKLYYVVVGLDGTVWSRTYTDTGGWTAAAQVADNFRSVNAPSLTFFDNKLWLTTAVVSGIVGTSFYDGTRWSSLAPDMFLTASDPVGMCVHDNRLWRARRKSDNNQVLVSRLSSGSTPTWLQDGLPNPGGDSTHGPTIVSHRNAVWEFFRKPDGSLWTQRYMGGGGAGWFILRQVGDEAIRPIDESAAVSLNHNTLYVMYRR